MNKNKGFYALVAWCILVIAIIIAGLWSLSHKDYKEHTVESKYVKSESHKEYTIDLTKTNAEVTFSTSPTGIFTGSNIEDTKSYYLYYDNSYNVYYCGYNSTYIPYLKDDGSWYKWNIKKGEAE